MPYCSAKAALETLGAGRKGIVWKGSVAHSGAGRVLPLLIYDLSWQVWADLAPQANSCFLLCFHHASKQQLLHPPLDKYADHEVMYSYFYCSRNVSGLGVGSNTSPPKPCVFIFLAASSQLKTVCRLARKSSWAGNFFWGLQRGTILWTFDQTWLCKLYLLWVPVVSAGRVSEAGTWTGPSRDLSLEILFSTQQDHL